MNAVSVLKDACAARKRDVEGRIAQVQRDYGYTGQQEVARLQAVLKEADSNFGERTKSDVTQLSPSSCDRTRLRGCFFIPNARGISRIPAIK